MISHWVESDSYKLAEITRKHKNRKVIAPSCMRRVKFISYCGAKNFHLGRDEEYKKYLKNFSVCEIHLGN